jgi:lipoyl(octanoyl) transferase
MSLKILDLGLMDYESALRLQSEYLEKRIKGEIEDTLILVEHPPVLTLGRRGDNANIISSKEELEALGVTCFEVSRGGDVTYHGPGQIVGYPIMDLNFQGKDVKEYVYKLEEVIIRLLKNEFEIAAVREDKKYTGVWVNNEKITAIGVAVKHWVTMHGFAFNVNTNLDHFKWINPCGITDKGVTSLEKILSKKQDFNKIKELVIKYFIEVFEVEVSQ